MKRILSLLFLSLVASRPASAAPHAPRRTLYPDYANIVLPPNIAPLNFSAATCQEAVLKALASPQRTLRAQADSDGIVRWNPSAWRRFLAENAGQALELTVSFPAGAPLVATNHIATAPIDACLTYRLIPPSYRGYSKLGIYERDLTSFAERPLYRNIQVARNQCVNCHTYNRADADTFLFHTRYEAGGTQIVSPRYGARKVDLHMPGLCGAGTYPAWHPSGDFIAFSVNETRQLFYETHPDRIEVFDLQSDLILYSLADNRVSVIEKVPNIFETFPTWSPDGRHLYTCRAITSLFDHAAPEFKRVAAYREIFKQVFYDLAVRDFDPATRKFSPPRTLIDARKSKKSISLPRVSPDGRWIVLSIGPYGTFHIWHRESNLWIYDLRRRSMRPLVELNGFDSESYHTFSRNGHWMVFSSRRDDGAYTRPYFAAFNAANGSFSKPFILPVENPADHTTRMLSYNVPEFATHPLKFSPRDLRRLVESTPLKPQP